MEVQRNGGWAEIRTQEGLRPAGFQDRCFQPLSHPSAKGWVYNTL